MKNILKNSTMKIITLVIFFLTALYLIIGGIWLINLDGSVYYLLLGLTFLMVFFLFIKNNRCSLSLYTAMLVVTIIWSLWEVGTDFWALAPRFDILFLLGIWLLIPATNHLIKGARKEKIGLLSSLVAILVILGMSVVNDPQEINGVIQRDQPTVKTNDGVLSEDWPAYARTQAGIRYSPLDQINSENVKNLQVAWTYHTEDFKLANDSGETTNEVTPIKVGDKVFICTVHQMVDALDAKTGERIWRFNPQMMASLSYQHLTCRGVSYYDINNRELFAASLKYNQVEPITLCPRKIILPVNDGRLIAINADTGEACKDFGNNGEIDLQENMPYAYAGGYNPTSPPIVTGTTIIIGGSVTDNKSMNEPSGVIRGYDVNTGKLSWAFDTGATDPNLIPDKKTTFVPNSPNAWAPLTYDSETNVVYIPTGVGTPDIWGGNRTELKERYANSILALNATTGELIWHFQTTHHDLWDMDVPSQPSLVDLKLASGEKLPAIYVVTKTGNVFVLNRLNGEHIVPITEKKVPQTVKLGNQTTGEYYSPTQPFSDLYVGPSGKLTDKDMWGATIFDQLICRIKFKSLNYDGIYTPPSENGTLVFPGNLGVFEWGGISINNDRQVALMNPIGLPFVSKLIPQLADRTNEEKNYTGAPGQQTPLQPMFGTPYGVTIGAFLSPLGLPCKQPSWGFVAAVDLESNQIIWKKRIGTIRDSLPNLFELPPLKIGVPGLGGVMSTAGDVMFVGATQDNYIRAFRVSDGKLLWENRLPAGGQATPMTYSIDGKQYVLIMAGGHGSFGTKMGDSLIAYKLPD